MDTYQITVRGESITLTPSKELLAGILLGLHKYGQNRWVVWNTALPTIMDYEELNEITEDYYAGHSYDPSHTWMTYANNTHGRTWEQFLTDKDFRDNNYRGVVITKLDKYTIIIPSSDPNNPYNYKGIIELYTFNTLEFLQGLISAIQWSGFDPHKLISLLHEGETPLDFL